jgi:hypothetical protein
MQMAPRKGSNLVKIGFSSGRQTRSGVDLFNPSFLLDPSY